MEVALQMAYLVVGSGDLAASDAEIEAGGSLHWECLRHSTTAFASTRDCFSLINPNPLFLKSLYLYCPGVIVHLGRRGVVHFTAVKF